MPSKTEVRATQSFVANMSFCWRHPSLTAIEVGWRWLFGIPFLLVLREQIEQILLRLPTDATGLNRVTFQNPWLSSILLAQAGQAYYPEASALFLWLAPAGILVWAVVSGFGRTLLLGRMNRLSPPSSPYRFLRRTAGVIVLQLLLGIGIAGVFWVWIQAVGWAAAAHISSVPVGTEPDLVGFLIWAIFITLGLFTAWALVSWVLGIAPFILLFEDCSAREALSRSFRLGKKFSSKLAELNLVMSIVKLALLVLALVFSSVPLPFSDQLGPGSLSNLYAAIVVGYLLAHDYFHVVRVKSFLELWRTFRAA